jgi:acid phosphatase
MTRLIFLAAAVAALSVLVGATSSSASADRLSRINHIVVIYEENHSFDNLYGGWEGVNGLAAADPAHTTQVDQGGTPFACLLQNDVNLASTCTFANEPFAIDDYIHPEDTTCPAPGVSATNGVAKGQGEPGGCTRDLVHRFYNEQYQLDNGKQDRYVTGSDAAGLSMGYYKTRSLPIYKYLHQDGAPHYAIADNFFQGAFGGSFLNHQWLIAAQTPTFPNPPAGLRSSVDANGMPTSTPLYTPTGTVADKSVTATCAQTASVGRTDLACGDYAVNTTQPPYQPYSPGTAASSLLPPQSQPNIGDRLNAGGISWAWYSGGWSNANGDVGKPGWTNGTGPVTVGSNTQGCPDPNANAKSTWPNCPDKLFQFHHQPFNYFADMAPRTANRAAHLRDEAEFRSLLADSPRSCELNAVSFVKPIGAENEHPGYTGENKGSDHLVDLLKAIEGSSCAKDTMLVVTYDEFGGSWDHVPPPGQGGAPGAHDQWGPGTRIPALIVSPHLRGDFVVDHTEHDTTSILATIEYRFGLTPLSDRDADVPDLSSVYDARDPLD